jgi:hypothetical protein
VIAITSGLKNMQGILDLVWDKLLPAMQSSSLTPDEAAQQKLQQKLKGLVIRLPDGDGEPAKIAGKKYVFPANDLKLESLSLEQDSGGQETLVFRIDGAQQRIACGSGKWQDGKGAWDKLPDQSVAAAGGWSKGVFTSKVCFYETPFYLTIGLRPNGDELTFSSEMNVGFLTTKQRDIIGKAE